MGEIRIYLSEDLHTDHLQEASRELIMKNITVSEKCTENLKLLSPRFSSEVVHEKVRQYIDPFYVPLDMHNDWKRKENWVSRMLVKIQALTCPEYVDLKLGEHLQPIDRFFAIDAALDFFHTSESRMKTLLKMRAPQQLSFTGYGAFAYAESRILRKAIFNKVFLTSPDPRRRITPINISLN